MRSRLRRYVRTAVAAAVFLSAVACCGFGFLWLLDGRVDGVAVALQKGGSTYGVHPSPGVLTVTVTRQNPGNAPTALSAYDSGSVFLPAIPVQRGGRFAGISWVEDQSLGVAPVNTSNWASSGTSLQGVRSIRPPVISPYMTSQAYTLGSELNTVSGQVYAPPYVLTASPSVLRVEVPYAWPTALTGVLPLAWLTLVTAGVLRHRAESRRRRAGRCVRCGYDLRATPGRCPECGQAPASAQRPAFADADPAGLPG
jgi:hypothetical protein